MTRPRRTVRAKEYKPRGVPDDAPEAVRIRMLGSFEVSIGSRAVEEGEWRLRKAAALVKLLALAPHHRMHRDQVMGWLWPELDQRAAANNLNYALHVARRVLDPAPPNGPRYLCLDGEFLALCPEKTVWVDVEAFEEAAGAARRIRQPPAYQAALDLYGDNLLPADLYESWTEDRREELQSTYLALLVELAGLYEEREEFGPAIEALGEAVTAEPAHEEAHTGLMRLHALSGRRTEALKQYERLEKVLSREYAVEPAAVSRRLYKQISAGRFPPPADSLPEESTGARRHNLPAARTSFVGREKELLEVERLLSTSRLLTLTGAGGCGKTRLALEEAANLVEAYPDGVWLVQLAPLSEGELVPQEVAEALEVREQPSRSLLDTLVDVLSDKKMLLVLDNCEHVVDAAAHLVDTLLGSCPGLRILATSRETLSVAGEANWQVPSLSLPDPEHPPTVEGLSGYESARLFLERARDRDPAFVLAPRNVPAIVEICHQLDGIPLAIELAAARVGMLTAEQISERLKNSLKLLTGGSRTVQPRHKTLRGTLDWSYDLLDEPEKRLFRRLSVFAGGWTLEAAEWVGGDTGGTPAVPIEEDDVLDLLSCLVGKSLVATEAGEGGAPRYRLLEPVRQYAREKLEAAARMAARPGEAEAIRGRHAAFFLALAEEAEKESDRPGHVRWLPRLETEHDNLRAALGWSLAEGGDAELGLRLAGALWLFWFTQGHSSEGRGWLERGISRGCSPAARAKALNGIGWVVLFQGDSKTAKRLLEESVILHRELKDEEGLASSLNFLGYVALLGGREDIPTAALLEEALALKPRIQNRHTIANTLVFAALDALLLRGDWDKTVALHEEALALFREIDDRWGMGLCLTNLGLIVAALGHHARATRLLRELMHRSRELEDKFANQYSFFGLACVADSRGHTARAARLWGVSEAVREAAGFRLPHAALSVMKYESRLAAARAALGEAAFERAWAQGKAMTPEEATQYALSEEEETLSPVASAMEAPPPNGKHTLPIPKSSLVGREKEIVEVKGRLRETRLLTLTGVGGTGKTRLALKVAEELVGAYGDGVWLVEFAPLSEGELVPKVAADALKVREQQERPMVETLIQALREKEILLVLDNCEHLVDAVACLTDTMLGTCPNLKVLATSREALGLAGEVNWPVPALSLPEQGRLHTVEELSGCQSVRLFVERASLRLNSFALTDQTSRAVADICWKLGGIPLAIELAAARVGVLSAEQISERLEDSLKLLTGGGRTTAPRHRTLEGTLDWSYELLGEPEKDLFGRLSVFAGGWALEAAEAVGAGGDIEREAVLDLLSSLVDKSLVVVEAGGYGAPRYSMLEPVRQYAREKLEDAGETPACPTPARPGEADGVRSRHAAFFIDLAEEAEEESSGPEYAAWMRRLEAEHDNLRAALGWSLDSGGVESYLRISGALWLFWYTRGHSNEGWGWLEQAISLGGPPAARAKVLNGAGWVNLYRNDFETAKTLVEESLALYRELEDEEGIASSLVYLGFVAMLGLRDDIPAADLLEEALKLKPRIKNRRTVANMLVLAGLFAGFIKQDWEEGEALHEEALRLFREVGDVWGMTTYFVNLGLVAVVRGDYARATDLLRELMRLSQEQGYKHAEMYSFFGLACVAASEGQMARAARLWGTSETVREETGQRLPPSARSALAYEDRLAGVRAGLGKAAFEEAWAEGKAMTQERAIEYTLSEVEEPTAPAPEDPPAELTRREREVALLVAQGLTNRRIASELTLSRRTVDNHVANVLKKLRLGSRSQVAAWLEERPSSSDQG